MSVEELYCARVFYIYACMCNLTILSIFSLFQAVVVDVDKQKFVRRVSTTLMSHTLTV